METETPHVIDQVAEHLIRYEALERLIKSDADADDLVILLSDLNAAFRATLDRLAT